MSKTHWLVHRPFPHGCRAASFRPTAACRRAAELRLDRLRGQLDALPEASSTRRRAGTPNIEALAAHGLIFDHAFSNAPVCSVARTTLATGCYGPRIGTQFHRQLQDGPDARGPADVPRLPPRGRLLHDQQLEEGLQRRRGRGRVGRVVAARRPGATGRDQTQPFFHMQSLRRVARELAALPEQRRSKTTRPTTDPDVGAARRLPSRHAHCSATPTPATTTAWARSTGSSARWSAKLEGRRPAGRHVHLLLRRPRRRAAAAARATSTRAGLHVPLVVRVPENWQAPGRRRARAAASTGFVSFIDFGPTAAAPGRRGRARAASTAGRSSGKGVSIERGQRPRRGVRLRRPLRREIRPGPLAAQGPVQVHPQLPAVLPRRPAEQLPLQDAGLQRVARAVPGRAS